MDVSSSIVYPDGVPLMALLFKPFAAGLAGAFPEFWNLDSDLLFTPGILRVEDLRACAARAVFILSGSLPPFLWNGAKRGLNLQAAPLRRLNPTSPNCH